VTATGIKGDWSHPIYLNRSGFDPSLFHDDDGKKWLVNMRWSLRIGRSPFAMIVLQEYDPNLEKLVGPIYDIFKGTELGLTEGPHLYKRNGYYHLLVAEGGTSYDHAVSMARSAAITGPYDSHPDNPILTSKGSDLYSTLQKAGHASLCETHDGEWLMVHLCGRPLEGTNRCVLGRETSLQNVVWKDDWLYMRSGSKFPKTTVQVPDLKPMVTVTTPEKDDFDNKNLNIHFNTLRVPADSSFMSLTERPGFLRLFGRESLESTFHQSLVARRQQSFSYTAETLLDFTPTSTLHMAGLVCYYNTLNYYYLRVTFDPELGGKCLGVLASQNKDMSASMLHDDNIVLDSTDPIYLRAVVSYRNLNFYYSFDGITYQQVGGTFDISTCSDDFAAEFDHAFTGAFVGMCCQDLEYGGYPADFDYFTYKEI
jgi:xylan 1,4-beta-xylosidase